MPLLATGFALTTIKDARPVEALKERDPCHFEKYSALPTFMVIETAKRA